VSYGGAAAGLMAGVLALKRRQLIGAFDRVGATSPATARTRQELGVRDSPMFRRLVRRGVLCSANNGSYYLDRQARARDRRRRLTVMAVVVLVALLGLAIVLLGSR